MEKEKKLDRNSNIMLNGNALGKTETVNAWIHKNTDQSWPARTSRLLLELKIGQETIHSSNFFPKSFQSQKILFLPLRPENFRRVLYCLHLHFCLLFP